MMKFKCKILITGCGGDIGQSIGKLLNNHVDDLYGIDISNKNAAQFIYNNFSLGERCTNENFISFLTNFVQENKIDFIIPVSEPELRFFSEHNIHDNIGGAKLITASLFALEIGFDKLKTAFFLKDNNLPFPETQNVNEVDQLSFYPVILKSRTGSGSSQVYVVHDNETFQYLKRVNSEFIVQEYLDDTHGEYTCGVFRSSKGEIRTIILKRELTGGFSGYGEVIIDNSIVSVLISIAEKLNLKGSINVQLRITSKGPVVFEINPRFSSTVLFRHLFGFKDVIWSIEDALGLPVSKYTANAIGKKFYKGFNEYIS